MSFNPDRYDPLTACPRCNIDLIPGYSIDPKGYDGCLGWGVPVQKAEDVEIVFTAKCTRCGHQEHLRGEYQTRLHENVPPGYTNWTAYWRADNKEIPPKWLATLFAR